eukprot:m.137483 g.137483  ORF g.137483 m.137483 type:complete len:208 (+) comp17583_c0_seq17:194-817(+)
MASSERTCASMGFGFRKSQTNACARCEQRRSKLFIPTSVWIDGRKRSQCSSSNADTLERTTKRSGTQVKINLSMQKAQKKSRASMAAIQTYHESLLAQYFPETETGDDRAAERQQSLPATHPMLDPRGDSAMFSTRKHTSHRPCILAFDKRRRFIHGQVLLDSADGRGNKEQLSKVQSRKGGCELVCPEPLSEVCVRIECGVSEVWC